MHVDSSTTRTVSSIYISIALTTSPFNKIRHKLSKGYKSNRKNGTPQSYPDFQRPPPTLTKPQVLAVDLLNPTPAAEARKHKLKVQIPSQYYTLITPLPTKARSNLQSLDPRPRPPLLLHGRKMPRLLHHHNRLLACPNSRDLRRLLDRAVSAHWWESEINRGMFV